MPFRLRFTISFSNGMTNRELKRNKSIMSTTFLIFPLDTVTTRCIDVDSSVSNTDNIMANTLLHEMSCKPHSRHAQREKINRVVITMEGEGFLYDI